MIAQTIQWCITVIQNASIRARQRKLRFSRDILIETLPETLSFYASYGDIELAELLNTLSEIESQVLYCTFILDLTQQEIAKRLNISQQQVSRVKRHALNSLRKEAV